jgi:transposase
MPLTPVGIDIAKAVFQVHYVDGETGEIVNKPIKRARFLEYFANGAPCLIGMEACADRIRRSDGQNRTALDKAMPAVLARVAERLPAVLDRYAARAVERLDQAG